MGQNMFGVPSANCTLYSSTCLALGDQNKGLFTRKQCSFINNDVKLKGHKKANNKCEKGIPLTSIT